MGCLSRDQLLITQLGQKSVILPTGIPILSLTCSHRASWHPPNRESMSHVGSPFSHMDPAPFLPRVEPEARPHTVPLYPHSLHLGASQHLGGYLPASPVPWSPWSGGNWPRRSSCRGVGEVGSWAARGLRLGTCFAPALNLFFPQIKMWLQNQQMKHKYQMQDSQLLGPFHIYPRPSHHLPPWAMACSSCTLGHHCSGPRL